MFRNFEAGKNVVISVVRDKEVEVGEILDVSKRLLVVKSKPPHPPRWREFYRDTGVSVKGEEFGKLLQDDDLAIKEASKVECPECHTSQINFFMAKEFLQGAKNFHCYKCKELLWLTLDGVVGVVKKVTIGES